MNLTQIHVFPKEKLKKNKLLTPISREFDVGVRGKVVGLVELGYNSKRQTNIIFGYRVLSILIFRLETYGALRVSPINCHKIRKIRNL